MHLVERHASQRLHVGRQQLLRVDNSSACSVYTGEYALPGSASLRVAPCTKGTKRGRDSNGHGAVPGRPPATARAAAVCLPLAGRSTVAKRSGGSSTDASRRSPAEDAAEHDSLVVQETLDTHASEVHAGVAAAPRAPVLEPGMVAIEADEERRLRARCAEVDGLRRDAEGLRLQEEAAVRRGDELDAAAADLRADVQRRVEEAARLQERLAAAQAEAAAAAADAASLRAHTERLTRENAELAARVRLRSAWRATAMCVPCRGAPCTCVLALLSLVKRRRRAMTAGKVTQAWCMSLSCTRKFVAKRGILGRLHVLAAHAVSVKTAVVACGPQEVRACR